jgi:hypothetical protein
MLLEAARTEARTATPAGAEDTVAAMVAAVRAHGIAVVPRRRQMRAKMAAAASAGLLALSGGMAAAGALPSAAQQQVSSALAKVGIDVPRGDRGRGHPGVGSHVPRPDNADPAGGASTNSHGDCVSQVAGNGGEQVSDVAKSDCGKPSTAGGPPAENTTHGAGTPAAVKPADKPQPTQPSQSSSGGHDGTSSENGGTPSPPGLTNNSARPLHEPPPPPTSQPAHSKA